MHKACFLHFQPNFGCSSIFTPTFQDTQSHQFLRLCGFCNVRNFAPQLSQFGIQKRSQVVMLFTTQPFAFKFLDLSLSLYPRGFMPLKKFTYSHFRAKSLCSILNTHLARSFQLCYYMLLQAISIQLSQFLFKIYNPRLY